MLEEDTNRRGKRGSIRSGDGGAIIVNEESGVIGSAERS
jgi:hypothetical protein